MINEVIIQGRLTADPEVNYTLANNIAVCNFSVACERPLRKDEEKATDFFDCVAWRTTAEFLARNFSKGDMIAVSGKLFSESYIDKNDNNRTAVKVRVTEINYAGMTKRQREQSEKAEPEKSEIPKGLEGMIYSDDEYVEEAHDNNDNLPF